MVKLARGDKNSGWVAKGFWVVNLKKCSRQCESESYADLSKKYMSNGLCCRTEFQTRIKFYTQHKYSDQKTDNMFIK